MENRRKVQFIICTTDQRELEECKFYISKLDIPEDVEIKITEVTGAESMAAGYNAAMQSSDAKYRIYIHQDTCLIYSRILYDLLAIFDVNPHIGMIGVVGARELPIDEIPHKAWDLGRVDSNSKPFELNYQEKEVETEFWNAEAIDGLFMATQYDIPWREDLFHKFDFYDISQSLEVKRNGYSVVVPYQKNPWCWHDNETSKLADYEGERQIFAREYQDIRNFELGEVYHFSKEQDAILDEFQANIIHAINENGIASVETLLEQYHNLLGSKSILLQLENICYVRKIEKSMAQTARMLYGDGLNAQDLLEMFREDKFSIKRIEYGYGEEAEYLLERHKLGEISKEAVYGLAVCYAKYRDKVMQEFERLTMIRS